MGLGVITSAIVLVMVTWGYRVFSDSILGNDGVTYEINYQKSYVVNLID
jgi:hypothetical protein